MGRCDGPSSSWRRPECVGELAFQEQSGDPPRPLAEHPEARIRDVAGRVGVTERTAQRIVSGLVSEGYLRRERMGRRNRYELVSGARLQHPVLARRTIGDLVGALRSQA